MPEGPVCGTDAGEIYEFCCDERREAFAESPEAYV